MRTLSTALLTELGRTFTSPGYLIEIGFSTTLRLSTMGDVAWNGHTWLGHDVRIAGLTKTESGTQGGQIVFGNADLAYGALVLNEGVTDKVIRIYAAYAGAPDDAVQEFEGVGDDAEVGEKVVIRLTVAGTRTAFSPRRFVNSQSGFNTLLPAKTKIPIGQTTFILERS